MSHQAGVVLHGRLLLRFTVNLNCLTTPSTLEYLPASGMSSTTLLHKLRELSAVDCDTLDSEGECLLGSRTEWPTLGGVVVISLSEELPPR